MLNWLDNKGYGFITADGELDDIFIHSSDLKNTEYLVKGQAVEFDLTKTDKGLRATNCRIIMK